MLQSDYLGKYYSDLFNLKLTLSVNVELMTLSSKVIFHD